MRGDIVYRVYGVHAGCESDSFLGAFKTLDEAEQKVARLQAQEMHGRNWAEQYHNKGFDIRTAVVETDFEIPSKPKPRDKYCVKMTAKSNTPAWDSTLVEVNRRKLGSSELELVCEYERSYAMLQTFEPFRQGDREFALISRDYTFAEVLDLATGKIVAKEADPGFCPVGFYVPDWWDIHSGHIIPGSERWTGDYEWPTGEFGFVWGCVWGDDNSWKVQYLDLRGVAGGTIKREERFGHLELATIGFENPCLTLDSPPSEGSDPPSFINVSRYGGTTSVTFAVEMKFQLDTGKAEEWQRLKIADWE